jgi:hypothetical protein
MIMFFQNLLKATPLIVLTLLNLNALHANAGGVSGGGGDASESQFGEIRNDLLRWIQEGGAHELQLPTHVSHEHYRTAMERVLAPHAVIVSFVTTAQESDPANRNPELRVTVDSQPKTCRGFISTVDSRPHILCNIERFANTQPAEQYRLVHHEFAGLAGVEQNIGASSDYQISSQLSEFLVPEVVLRLAVRRNQARGPDRSFWRMNSFRKPHVSPGVAIQMEPGSLAGSTTPWLTRLQPATPGSSIQ